MTIDQRILESKDAASNWARLFVASLEETADVEEALIVTDLAFASLPKDARLSIEDKKGNLHSEKSGEFVKKGGKEEEGKKTETIREKNERLAAKWVRNWSLVPGSPSLPKGAPRREVEKILHESRPDKPIKLWRWERVDHDDKLRDMGASMPYQSWTTDGETAKETVEDLNSDPFYTGPKLRLLERVFRPEEIIAVLDNLPESVQNHIAKATGGENNKWSSGMGEVVTWHPKHLNFEEAKLSINAHFAWDIENRRAQGVLNRAIDAAKKISQAARRDLERSLMTDDPAELSRALVSFVQKYKVQLADLLTTTQLAAVLEGAREVAKSLPTIPIFPGAALPPATLEPAKAVELVEELRQLSTFEREQRIYDLPPDQQHFVRQGLLAVQQGGAAPPETFTPSSVAGGTPEKIHYPIIDEAAKSLAEKNVMTRADFDQLEYAARQKAFTVAHIESLDTIAKIRDAMSETVTEGVDLATFREKVLAAVDEGTFMSDAHLEVVFRTNVQTAFSDGQMKVLEHPFVRLGFPYAAYEAIHDDRVRHQHLELESMGIDGTNIYRIDDPVFVLFRPPFAYNCRCSWIPMTIRMAASKGIQEAKDWVATGVEPTPPARVAMPSFRPPPGFERSLNAMPLSIQLSLQPLVLTGVFLSQESGRWITIGGKEGADGKNHGGSPVYIENGKITKGHPSLTGKKLGSLKDEAEPSSHHKRLAELKSKPRSESTEKEIGKLNAAISRSDTHKEKNYQSAVWAKKARKHGIDSKSLHALASDMKAHHDNHAKDVKSLLQKVRGSKLANVDHRTLKKAFDGGDHSQIPGFDILSREASEEYPHLLGSHGYDSAKGFDVDAVEAADKLFELLKQGNPEPMQQEEAYAQAFDFLVEQVGSQKSEREPGDESEPRRKPKKPRRVLTEEPIPFSLSWDESKESRDDHGRWVEGLGNIGHGDLKHVGGLPVRRTGKDEYRIDTDKGHVTGSAEHVAGHIGEDHSKRVLHGKKRNEALKRAKLKIDTKEKIIESIDKQYQNAAEIVDGRKVLPVMEPFKPGKDLTDYHVIQGVREFPLDAIGNGQFYASDKNNIDSLAKKIDESKTITPIDVVMSSAGPQIGEGNHRIAALKKLGAKSFPANIILDIGDLTTPDPFSTKTAEEPDAINDPAAHKAAAEGFARLPKGAKVVSLHPDTHGRVGEIVKVDGVNRVKLESTPGYASDHVEPLDESHSWRVESKPLGKKAKKEGLFEDDNKAKAVKKPKAKTPKREIRGDLEEDTANFFKVKPEQGRLFSANGIFLAQVHAPHTMTVNGKEYQGGQFIPGNEIAKLNADERKELLSNEHVRAADEGDILAHDAGGEKLTYRGDKGFTEKVGAYFENHLQLVADDYQDALLESEDYAKSRDMAEERVIEQTEHYADAIWRHYAQVFSGVVTEEDKKAFDASIEEARDAAIAAIYDVDEDDPDFDDVRSTIKDICWAIKSAGSTLDDAIYERNREAEEEYESQGEDASALVDELAEMNEDDPDGAMDDAGIYNRQLEKDENPFRLWYDAEAKEWNYADAEDLDDWPGKVKEA